MTITALLAPVAGALAIAPTPLDVAALPAPRSQDTPGGGTLVEFENVASNAELFEPVNEVILLDLASEFGLPSGTRTVLTGIGWDITIASVGESWMAEALLWLSRPDNIEENALFIQPGNRANRPGTETFSTEGAISIVDEDFPGLILPDGMLRIEFFETFDDETLGEPGGPAVADAFLTGSLTLVGKQYIPAPGTALPLAAAALLAARRRRR